MAAGIIVVAERGSSPIVGAQTTLGAVKNAKIVDPSGATHLAVAGDRVSNGEVVTTGRHGSAELITRQRRTLLGGMAALEVVNGGRQQLRTGTAVIDSLTGPGLDLDLGLGLVAIPRGSATEASRGPSTRVGALSGPASITSASGRQLALPALAQAVLSGDALPAATTPLHLTDSVDEDSVAPSLVRDDIALNALARGIDTTGRSTAHVIEASWTGTAAPVPSDVNRSEKVLPVLIADSTHGGTAQQRYNAAVGWRAEGGSWGVVLHLLAGRASSVELTLAALQKRGQAPGQIGTVRPTGGTVSAVGPPTVFTTPPPSNSKGPKRHRNNAGGSPKTGTKPPPPDNLLGSLVATVQSVINGVFGILPHQPASSADPTTVTAKQSSATKPATTKPATTKAATTKAAKPSAVTSTRTTAATSTVRTVTSPKPIATRTPTTGLLGTVLGGLLG